jgi:hypothetical protein
MPWQNSKLARRQQTKQLHSTPVCANAAIHCPATASLARNPRRAFTRSQTIYGRLVETAGPYSRHYTSPMLLFDVTTIAKPRWFDKRRLEEVKTNAGAPYGQTTAVPPYASIHSTIFTDTDSPSICSTIPVSTSASVIRMSTTSTGAIFVRRLPYTNRSGSARSRAIVFRKRAAGAPSMTR